MSIVMAALLCSAPLSALRCSDEWDFCRWIIPLVMFFFLCKIIVGDERGEIPLIQPLLTLLFCCISFLMKGVGGNQGEKKAEYAEKRSSGIKDSANHSAAPKKRNRKDKKKKRNRAMDEETEGSPKLDSYKWQEKTTKVYAPLQQFLNLNMEMPDLYNEFTPFTLTEEQFVQNGFPRDSPERPGRITSMSSIPGDQSLRHCARCGVKFHISDKGKYSSETACVYHPKKISSYQGVPGAGGYPCCNGNYMSKGCREFTFHVSAEHFLDDVIFSKVREKRQVRGGLSCSVYALDCEMSYTTAGLEVTKIGVVSLDGLTVYETFVLPEHQILDYNTAYSGVTANDLKGVKTTLSDVQAFLLRLLNKDSILVGHGLQNDLKALRLIHERIVDTAVVFPHQYGGHYRRSLKSLADEHLDKRIQEGDAGHDCIEDARTCIELMLLKIKGSLQDRRLPAVQDENKNSFLQNYAEPQPLDTVRFSRKYMQPLYINKNGTYCFIPHITDTWTSSSWLDNPMPTCFC